MYRNNHPQTSTPFIISEPSVMTVVTVHVYELHVRVSRTKAERYINNLHANTDIQYCVWTIFGNICD